MTVLLAQISESMSDPRSEYRVVTVHAGPDRDNLKFAGNLILPKEDADVVVAILDGLDKHVIEFQRHGWVVKHPLACRTDLFLCDANGHDLDVDEDGRYVLERDANGFWQVGEKTNG